MDFSFKPNKKSYEGQLALKGKNLTSWLFFAQKVGIIALNEYDNDLKFQ
jgi:hypothetical protein